ncbi:hypothetical protein K458DRAFT_371751 [Lentithecium fluviatile CBS 122367]|uniref:Uncharacterized protein n=1 Tax=Lentithecium fluviatile CBS 122367 TaxID=1168545 RepID=A0A6G1IU98_9PLEO|nr:hypothetical protein K458DRAFT_371751 [Lentithecium fluviatile CBS 122367]
MYKTQPGHQIPIQSYIPPDRPASPPPPFPDSLPPRTQPAGYGRSWKDRNCPGMRGFWEFSLNSYSLRTSDKAVLARRICMIVVLGCRTAISVLGVIKNAFGMRIVSLILGIILGILGFLFVGWCLAQIGEAKGVRVVFGKRVGRWHFDVFLIAIGVLHVGILIAAFFGMDGGELPATWLVLWLLIWAVAWVTTWEPEPQSAV